MLREIIATSARYAYHANDRQWRTFMKQLQKDFDKTTISSTEQSKESGERVLPSPSMCVPASASILAKRGIVG